MAPIDEPVTKRTMADWFRAPTASTAARLRRAHNRRLILLGHALRGFGLILLLLVAYGAIGWVILMSSPHGGPVDRMLPRGFYAVVLGVPVGLVMTGTVLTSLRKRSVLFLRRFGDVGMNERIKQALESYMHRNYRLVALDDSVIEALGVAQGTYRKSTRLVYALVATCLLLVAGSFVMARYGGTSSPLFVAPALFVLAVPAFIAFVLALPTLAFIRGRVRRASRIRVSKRDDLERLLRRVARLGRWWRAPNLIAPQAMVVSVTDDLWQKTVTDLMQLVDVVVVDLSEPTGNILWEVEQVMVNHRHKCVVIGEQERLAHALTDESLTVRQILNAVRGATLVTYDRDHGLDERELLPALDTAGPTTAGYELSTAGRFLVAAVVGSRQVMTEPWRESAVRRFFEVPTGDNIRVVSCAQASAPRLLQAVRDRYPEIDVVDYRESDRKDRVILLPGEQGPEVISRTFRRRLIRRSCLAFAASLLIAGGVAAGWCLIEDGHLLEYHRRVHESRSLLNVDPHAAARRARIALRHHAGAEASEALLDALERTRPYESLDGATGPASWRPTGDEVLAPCRRGVCVWNLRGELVRTMGASSPGVLATAWHPDGSRVLSIETDGFARVWSEAGTLLQSHLGTPVPNGTVRASLAAWDHTGGLALLIVNGRQPARIWHLASDTISEVQMPGAIADGAWQPTGGWLALLSEQGEVRVVDERGVQQWRTDVHGYAKSVVWSPGGHHLAVISDRVTIAEVGSDHAWVAPESVSGVSGFAAWHPTRDDVAVTIGGSSVAIYSASGELRQTGVGARMPQFAQWTADGRRLWVSRQWQQVYELPLDHPSISLGLPITSVGGVDRRAAGINPQGTHSLVQDGDRLTIWSLAPGPPRHVGREHFVAAGWKATGDGFALATADGRITLFDRTGEETGSIQTGTPEPQNVWFDRPGESVYVSGLRHTEGWSIAGRALVSSMNGPCSPNATGDRWVCEFDRARMLTRTGEVVRDFGTHRPNAIRWSPDGGRVAIAAGGVIAIWTEQGQPVTTIGVDAFDVRWRRDGQRLLVVGSAGSAGVWRLDGSLEASMPLGLDRGDRYLAGSWSPDGRFVATASEHGIVQIAERGAAPRRLATLDTDIPYVRYVTLEWSPDGSQFLLDDQGAGPWLYRIGSPGLWPLWYTAPFELLRFLWSPSGDRLIMLGRGRAELHTPRSLLSVAGERLGAVPDDDDPAMR
jgi:WD40 repeat protein